MDLQAILQRLFGQQNEDDYFSVLEERNMENPRYRQYLEKQQSLENVYPELALMMRGSGPTANLAGRAPVQIGSRVQAPSYGSLSEIDQKLLMDLYKLRQRSKPADLGGLGKAYSDSANNAMGRFTLEALMGGNKYPQQQ